MEYDELIESATLKVDLKLYDDDYNAVFLVDENINIRVEAYDETSDVDYGAKRYSYEFADINEVIDDIIKSAEINKRKVSEQALEYWIDGLLADVEFEKDGHCEIKSEVPYWELWEEE